MKVQLTQAQQQVIDRLSSGWTIIAQTPTCLTEWVSPRALTAYACPLPTLKALAKKGIVRWENRRWVLIPSSTEASDK